MGDSTDRALGSLSLMAWGLLLVVIDIRVGVDLVPDPLGWLLALGGAASLRRLHGGFSVATFACGLGLLGSLPDWLGGQGSLLALAASVAETVLVFAVCTAIIDLVPGRRAGANAIRWWDLGLTVALVPVLALASDQPDFEPLVLLTGLAVFVVFISFLVLLFRTAGDQPVRSS
jgi:hypothetical protein